MNSSLNIKRLIFLIFLAFHYSCSKQDSFENNELTAVIFENLSENFPTMKINTNGRPVSYTHLTLPTIYSV